MSTYSPRVTGHQPPVATLVSKVPVVTSLPRTVDTAFALIGGLSTYIAPGEDVLICANFNSPDRYPASTDPDFIAAVVSRLKAFGVGRIILGASSGLAWQPTAQVIKKLKIDDLACRLGITLVDFDHENWHERPVNGLHFNTGWYAETALQAQRNLYLANMKTHRLARFSLSLKLSVGLTGPVTRRQLHAGSMEEKIADLNLVRPPDVIIMDTRKCLITGVPAKGRKRKPGLVLASSCRIAMDVESLKIMQSYRAKNRLTMTEWQYPQITAAVRLGLGVTCESQYRLVSPPALDRKGPPRSNRRIWPVLKALRKEPTQ